VTIRKAAGFALLDLIFVVGIIGVLCSISLPKLILAKQAAGAASAIGSLRTISSAQLTYALTCGSGFYAPDFPTLGIAPPGSNEPFISPEMSAGHVVQKSGYNYRMEGAPYPGAPPSCNGLAAGSTAQGFRAAADPTDSTNFRFFGANSIGQLYEDNTTMFDDMPESGDPGFGTVLR
jgi:type II secretory pathway pseudopilin PulG